MATNKSRTCKESKQIRKLDIIKMCNSCSCKEIFDNAYLTCTKYVVNLCLKQYYERGGLR